MSVRQKVKATYPRLGELLVQRKLVSADALEHALAVQRSVLERSRKAPKLGEILVRQRAISKRTVHLILSEQKVARGELRKLEVSIEEPKPGILMLKLAGGLERETDATLVRILEKLMDRGVHQIILDCSPLVAISSYSISSIVAYVDECRARGGDLALCGLRAQPKLTFDRLGLLPFLTTYETAEEAIQTPSEANAPPVAEFVSSFTSKCFHFSYCPEIKKLEEETRLYYMSRQNAQKGGKRPCPKCKPWF